MHIINENIFVFDLAGGKPEQTNFSENISKYIEIYLAITGGPNDLTIWLHA